MKREDQMVEVSPGMFFKRGRLEEAMEEADRRDRDEQATARMQSRCAQAAQVADSYDDDDE